MEFFNNRQNVLIESINSDKVTYYAPFVKHDRVEDYRKTWEGGDGRF